jgi:hypothetical protein
MCIRICEYNFERIYDKFDDFSEFTIHKLNTSLTNVNSELNLIINQSSILIIKKLNDNLIKISHNHAKLDANYHILCKLLNSQNEENEFIHLFENQNEYKKGMNIQIFLIAFILFFITGYYIEYVRMKREGHRNP